ncbi:aconitate hydratase AcnA [Saccharopolyspora sp. HNM0986]|uniref:aconitate hydratase AcnA n=1 Tax=Saccharopolyspora galaxeae TaxID=2781241 RepID=UPI0019095ADF|nr:aconitate hydratase AcnA [Saccharopolyspora sp. HNM0986]MBK0868889.1 aconitate hydratase AcnA [Saccharopolyspora sp. HNM0986]
MGAARTAELAVGERAYRYVPLLELAAERELATLPYAIRVLLENVARRAPGSLEAVLRRALERRGDCEVPLHPNRIMLHDTTCLPALADFAGMRDGVADLGGDPALLQPAIPVDLTVDHSVIAEEYGTADAAERNLLIDFRRNRERYEFIRWAERSIENFRVVPPGTGIIHQVNMESLARVVWTDPAGDAPLLHPDLLVATDSHTPMINSIGVVGWGVGGLQAQAAMLGEPVVVPFPTVVGVRLLGRLRSGVTATDLALTVTEVLRAHGVIDKFVEFVGPGATGIGWADRAAVSNMAPEYGATCAFFPFDQNALDYLALTGRDAAHREVVAEYLRAQGLFRTGAEPEPVYDETITIDLDTVEPSVAGPRLPHERVPLSAVPGTFRAAAGNPEPASGGSEEPAGQLGLSEQPRSFAEPVPAGAVAIASITSCTNTANPALMVQAGLLAQRAAERGLRAKPWVKTSLSPGSRVVSDYLDAAGLLAALADTGFHVAGFGCMTCIGNSGPLQSDMDTLVERGFTPAAVLSGNRNFAGRINPKISLAYLASPPLVVAYALAGSVLHDFTTTPIGHDRDGDPVHLADLWPSDVDVQRVVADSVQPELFRANTAKLRDGTEHWHALPAPEGTRFSWDEDSTYIRKPPYLTGLSRTPPAGLGFRNGRVLLWLGDDVTTDHISPAGAIPADSAAGEYLRERGTQPRDLNQYSTRRSNHEVMLRGAFTNRAVENLLLREESGSGGRALDSAGHVSPVYDAAMSCHAAEIPLVVIAGRNYGAGSSRDWAAKAQSLLGVRAVVAENFERIHRSNLIGMGVLPLVFEPGESADDHGFHPGDELDLHVPDALEVGLNRVTMTITRLGGAVRELRLRLRLDSHSEISYLEHGGTLPYVVRKSLPAAE